MADDRPDVAWRVIGAAVGLVTAWGARKLLGLAWVKATGKEPPLDPDSPEVSMGEAIGYAVVMGVGMSVAQIVVNRTAKKRYDSWRALKQVSPKQ
ncbi:DUF4235 domain-containing protein [Nonomuraea glycinis]|jgi:hypothetical protein|uniref:DUF4235 domain-containing protein n=1 Tax=Nonomuraea glycinis TaxID=2047744 RepID=A0A918E709_9ACTN|nr:DUF4235 domain-containing protein [Nonomuraea glycinis]MCA2179440.1 DUF4235 domain-containing protein [Nonomuraea glycinis]WSG67464.1 DUF4235 domain-containing protein [Nonomuraea glycinis]GGP09700.1 hypothetical protein GCM10012278_46370 [Nonomuraea glycinis]